LLIGGHSKSVDDIIFLQDSGFDFAELILNDRASLNYWSNCGLADILRNKFLLLAHGPREGNPNDERNLWTNYLPSLRETVDIAASMDIRFLTIHLWLDPRFVEKKIIEQKLDALKVISRYGERYNLVISLENLSESFENLMAAAEAIPSLAITLDIGHGELLSDTNTSYGIIRNLVSRVKHIHIHDNLGGLGVKDDLHLPLGAGIIDFHAILGELLKQGYNNTITLELEKADILPSKAFLSNLINLLTLNIDG
jgi:sugar phosphate isomerase/epimerase